MNCRTAAIWLGMLLALALAACGGRKLGNDDPGQDGGVNSGVDAGNTNTNQPTGCQHWDVDLTHANHFDINRLGFGISRNVAEGTLDQVLELGDQTFVSFHVDTMWYGAFFLEGLDTWVEVDEAELSTLSLPGSYVIGFRGNSFPLWDDDLQSTVWWHKSALIPSSMRDEFGELIGYQSRQTPLVAVVRIVQQDADRTWFEVVQNLQGDLPALFGDNWSTSLFPVSYPAPSSTEYIASTPGVNDYGGEYIGTVMDFRPSTPDNLALVQAELAAPVEFWSPADGTELRALADEYRLGWTYKIAPHVLATEVFGIAEECCTGAGGTFIAHELLEVLQGATARDHTITGGHAYYGPETCGEPFLLAVHGLDELSGFNLADFACDGTGVVVVGSEPHGMPSRVLQLDDTVENRRRVTDWLASAPAAFRLHPPDEPVPLDHVLHEEPTALWSQPASMELTLLASTHLSLITIEQVEQFTEPDRYEVTFSTTFSEYRLEHQTVYRAKIAFQCGDPRLLQEGTDWLGGIVFDGNPYLSGTEFPPYPQAFLIPGVLLPNHTYIRHITGGLPPEILASPAP